MEHDWLMYIAAFACAFGITLVSTPTAKKLAIRVGAVSYPRKRDMHTVPIPSMGGTAIVLGFMVSMAVLAIFIKEVQTPQFLGFIVGAIIVTVTGVVDDIYDLKARTKLVMQIIAALIVVFSGTKIEIVMWPFTTYLESLSAPITLLWIVGVTNAVNFIDGLDGLAAGVSTICACCLMVLCVLSGSPLAVALTAALAGSCLGFLPRNFNPAELIMGDTGALFLGYVLSVSSIIGVYKGYALLAVVISVFSMALPIGDILFATIRRLLKGKSPGEADRGHLHHRLVDSGYSHKQAVILLYGVSILTAVIAIVIAVQDVRAIIVAFAFVFVMLVMLYVYRKRTQEPPDKEKK